MWHERSRAKWINDGDKNTSDYYVKLFPPYGILRRPIFFPKIPLVQNI